ncbi:MAG TPA: MAC/perforin domain-containing protein [Ferruginibacter sp.]|nr:MAC/perforin domain-containing protein [Ferruginibacter sp.]HPH92160.1 MAC/perforin domain-containing protein [Ferruginibacter sp.]
MHKLFSLIIILQAAVGSYGQHAGKWALSNPYLSRIDAAYPFNEDYITLISNRSIVYMPIVESPNVAPLTALLPGNLFPAEYNSKPLSGAISYDKKTVLLFKGNVYLPVDKETLTATGAVGAWNGWPAFWNNDIDAAMEWPDGNYVFIKGLQYVSYDPRSGKTSGTAQLNSWPGWPTSWSGSIDAAFNGGDGYLYFIRKGNILVMDASTKRFVPGYPKSLAAGSPGAIVAMTGTNQFNQDAATTTTTTENQNITAADNSAEWCAVGTPDPKKSSATGSITPSISPLAGAKKGASFRDLLPAGTRVSEIRVWGTWNINAIEIVTESKEGFVTESGKHGFAFGSPKIFKLVPGECITGIEGTWGSSTNEDLYTLKFITNKRKSPEFGGAGGMKGKTSFTAVVPPEASFAGFAGNASDNLNAIGIQYYIIQYLFVDANGKIIEDKGDKSAWASGQTDPTKIKSDVRTDGKTDPYSDSLTDIRKLTGEERFAFFSGSSSAVIMPNDHWVGKAVDLTKIDPFDITQSTGLPSQSPLYMIAGTELGGPYNTWYVVNGYNRNKSMSVTAGNKTEKVKALNTYNAYANEFAIQAGGSVGVPMVAAGSVNVEHTERQTQKIGNDRVMFTQSTNRTSHFLSFDLAWEDAEGKKFRQKLSAAFRRDVAALPVPKGKMNRIDADGMKRGGTLPENINRFRKDYQALIDKWGTHYLNDIEFGGYYRVWMMMTKEELERTKMTMNAVGAKFKATVKKVEVGVDAAVQVQSSSAGGSSTSTSEVHISATGGGGNTNYEQWESDVSKEPRPKSFIFYSIDTLLSEVFFPFDEDISKKQQVLSVMIRQYLLDKETPITHDRYQAIDIPTNDQQNTKDALDSITIKVEFVRMKTDIKDGKADRGEDKNQLYGKLSYGILGVNDASLRSGTFWEKSSKGWEGFVVGSWSDFNEKNTQVKIPKGQLAETRLFIYGLIKEEDRAGGGDDVYFDKPNAIDGVETGFEALQAPGSSKNIPVTLSHPDGKGAVQIMVRITWVK